MITKWNPLQIQETMSLMSKEEMESKITLMILAEEKVATLIYSHTKMPITLPKLKGFTPYIRVNEAQEKAKEIAEIYYNTKLEEIK